MSVPQRRLRGRHPSAPVRPGLVAVPSAGPAPAAPPSEEQRRLRLNLTRVLAGMRWPASRWQVLAEAEAWGVSGVVRAQLVPLPDGRYPSLEAVLEVLAAVARGRTRRAVPPPTAGTDRRPPANVVARRHVGPARHPAAAGLPGPALPT